MKSLTVGTMLVLSCMTASAERRAKALCVAWLKPCVCERPNKNTCRPDVLRPCRMPPAKYCPTMRKLK